MTFVTTPPQTAELGTREDARPAGRRDPGNTAAQRATLEPGNEANGTRRDTHLFSSSFGMY